MKQTRSLSEFSKQSDLIGLYPSVGSYIYIFNFPYAIKVDPDQTALEANRVDPH